MLENPRRARGFLFPAVWPCFAARAAKRVKCRIRCPPEYAHPEPNRYAAPAGENCRFAARIQVVCPARTGALPVAGSGYVRQGRSGLVPQYRGGGREKCRRARRRLAVGVVAVSVRRFGVLVGGAARLHRRRRLPAAGWQQPVGQALADGRAGRLRAADHRQQRHRSAALLHAQGSAAARPGRHARRGGQQQLLRHFRFHRRDADIADHAGDWREPVYRCFLAGRDRADRCSPGIGVRVRAVQLAAPAGPQGGRNSDARARGDCRRRQEAHHRRPRADPHRSAGGGDSQVRARDQGKAGAAVPGSARHAAAAPGSARRAAARPRDR